ncbi:serine permease, partial [Francisella tularensis subsp. holarctica]|nr:serine permease [Francisella tularensis subsp. holarctica]
MKKNEYLMWSLSLYGTAIGAGVQFLPIQTGISGIIPILVI